MTRKSVIISTDPRQLNRVGLGGRGSPRISREPDTSERCSWDVVVPGGNLIEPKNFRSQ